MIETTTSADGTTVAFERSGHGDPLLLLGGAFNTRMSATGLADLLAPFFTVYTIDRRGRGDSGMASPHSVEREIEDVAAAIRFAGGEAHLYGHSSGGVLALEAAAAGLPVVRLAVYEPPYGADPSALSDAVAAALAAENPEAAALAFLGPDADGMRQQSWWPGMVAMAHTLPYDLALVADGSVPIDRLARIESPTLVVDGSVSEPWGRSAADAVGAAIPHATRHTIDGQGHGVADEAIAMVLEEFFG